mmetsp:Transcript_3514/g.9174  ORF Transcript_3514/g.9174 Transcript_3514/m.9174 type:complete len:258 (-) Transcript_3514:805-1578(-)
MAAFGQPRRCIGGQQDPEEAEGPLLRHKRSGVELHRPDQPREEPRRRPKLFDNHACVRNLLPQLIGIFLPRVNVGLHEAVQQTRRPLEYPRLAGVGHEGRNDRVQRPLLHDRAARAGPHGQARQAPQPPRRQSRVVARRLHAPHHGLDSSGVHGLELLVVIEGRDAPHGAAPRCLEAGVAGVALHDLDDLVHGRCLVLTDGAEAVHLAGEVGAVLGGLPHGFDHVPGVLFHAVGDFSGYDFGATQSIARASGRHPAI